MKKPKKDERIFEKLSEEIASLKPDDKDAIVDVFTVLNPIEDFFTIMNFLACFQKPKLRKLACEALMLKAGYLFTIGTSSS